MNGGKKGLLVVHRPTGSTSTKQHEVYYISYDDLAQYRIKENEEDVAKLVDPYSQSKPRGYVLQGEFKQASVTLAAPCCAARLDKIKEALDEPD